MGIKEKTLFGMLWSFLERFGVLSILFVSNIILARNLSPDDIGAMGILLAITSVISLLVDGGLGDALIQKKKLEEGDASTIFYANMGLSLVLYMTLYVISPGIAKYYEQENLMNLLRVLGICIVFDSFSIVQNSLYVKSMRFKKMTQLKVCSAFLAAALAICAVYAGFGVWSIVIQNLTNSVMRSLLFWIHGNWYPTSFIRKKAFSELFGFGFKLMLANLLHNIYENLLSLLIGHYFSKKLLGFFTQARNLEQVPTNTLSFIVNQVTFPVFSLIQDDLSKLKDTARKIFRGIFYINTYIVILLAVIAKPLFITLFTEKWERSVPYFQILCLGFGLLLVTHRLNLNLLKSLGKSDLVLYLEIVKKILGFALIFAMLPLGMEGVLYALTIASFLEFLLNGYFVGMKMGYGIWLQIHDFLPAVLVGAASGIATYLSFLHVQLYPILQLMLEGMSFTIIYFLLSVIFRLSAFEDMIQILKDRALRKT